MIDERGVDDRYTDALGVDQAIDAEARAAIRELVGAPAPTGPPPLVVRASDRLPLGPGEVVLEDGGLVDVDPTAPVDLPLGYHSLRTEAGERRLTVAPDRCHLPDGWRAWGWACQLYATRSAASWGMGDLADLDRLATWSAAQGAGFTLINPLGAGAPVGRREPSPYSPATRRFADPTYLRVEEVHGAELAAEAVELGATAGQALLRDRTIDRDQVWRLKSTALEAVWHAQRDTTELDRWCAEQGSSLREFARWSVLAERFGPDWHRWPAGCRRPDGTGVAAAVAGREDRVRYHEWLQWNLARQLARPGRRLALVQDLPIGVDPGGFDAWTWQGVLALDASVGAPPDEFNTGGQDWGLPPFVPWRLRDAGYEPFVQTIRSALAPGGGLRIDHVMGMFRLWWLPRGASATQGAFVRYPSEDLLAIIALESVRARALVIGEDLGTVEDEARRALAEHRILSYKLLWFEEDPPPSWAEASMAAVTTHDLPTVAGLWTGSDLQEQEDLGLGPNVAATEAIRRRLAVATELHDDADATEAVRRAHRLLAEAPSRMLVATLDDACVEPARPNLPGAGPDRRNWARALPRSLEDLEHDPLAAELAGVLSAATSDVDPAPPAV